MIERTLTGALGTVVVAATVAAGLWAVVSNYVLESAGALLMPTLATVAAVVAFVFALFVLGARSDRWLQNPYW